MKNHMEAEAVNPCTSSCSSPQRTSHPVKLAEWRSEASDPDGALVHLCKPPKISQMGVGPKILFPKWGKFI